MVERFLLTMSKRRFYDINIMLSCFFEYINFQKDRIVMIITIITFKQI